MGIVKILLQKGANPYICKRDGDTPIQVALSNEHKDVACLIRDSLIERLQSMDLSLDAPGTSNNNKSISSTPEGTIKLECAVCMDTRVTTVMTLPCRHAVTCQNCMDDLEARGDSKCPIFRSNIAQRIPIFLN